MCHFCPHGIPRHLSRFPLLFLFFFLLLLSQCDASRKGRRRKGSHTQRLSPNSEGGRPGIDTKSVTIKTIKVPVQPNNLIESATFLVGKLKLLANLLSKRPLSSPLLSSHLIPKSLLTFPRLPPPPPPLSPYILLGGKFAFRVRERRRRRRRRRKSR